MKIIGVTGNSGSGKSAVCGILAQRGAYVVNADRLAREVLKPCEPAYNECVAFFGEDILLHDKTINRKLLADIVFLDEQKRQKLMDITHKRILLLMRRDIARVKADPGDVTCIVLDAPLLIEANLHTICDQVWLVYAAPDVMADRIMTRDGLTREQALLRLSAQPSFERLRPYATHVIVNDGDLRRLTDTVDALRTDA